MQVIDSERVVMVDTDDTVCLWDLSEYPDKDRVILNCFGSKAELVPHEKNINTLRKFHKLGYTIIMWSATGAKWAACVAKAVGIEDIVTLVISKPRYYFDDIDCKEWMGPRLWRNPRTGEAE